MSATSIKICDISFENPVLATGVFAFGGKTLVGFDYDLPGAVVMPGVTMKPETEQEKVVNTHKFGALTSESYPNPGVYRVVGEEMPSSNGIVKKKMIASVAGKSVEEMVKVAEILDRSEKVSLLILDATCQNREKGGMPFAANATSLYKLTQAVKDRVRKPVFVKLLPMVTDITVMAKAVQDANGDGVIVSGAFDGMTIDLDGNKTFGKYSAREVKSIVMKQVYDVYDAVGLPIVALGGISSAEDVAEMMLAGASLVMVEGENTFDFGVCAKIIKRLPEIAKKMQVMNLADAIGKAH